MNLNRIFLGVSLLVVGMAQTACGAMNEDDAWNMIEQLDQETLTVDQMSSKQKTELLDLVPQMIQGVQKDIAASKDDNDIEEGSQLVDDLTGLQQDLIKAAQ